MVLNPQLSHGGLLSALSGQTLLEQIYNPKNNQFSIRLSLPVSLQDSIAKGDQDYSIQFGFLMPDGSKILPGGSSTTILQSNCGFALDEQTGIKTYEIFWQFHLGLLVPSLVNLQPCLTVSNVYGKTVWDNHLGQVFQRADDGVANEDRPRAVIQPSALDPFVGGAALLNLVVKVYNYALLGFGDYMDLRRRGGSTDFGFKRSLIAATIIATELNCIIWNTESAQGATAS